MRTIKVNIVLSVFLLLSTQSLWAGELSLPHTFSAGSPAIAAEVNDNFAAVKGAVDDNSLRIINNDVNKQNLVSGSCSEGSSIRAINTDGSVVCEPDNDSGGTITGVTVGAGLSGGGVSGVVNLKPVSGAVSISAAAFDAFDNSICHVYKGSYAYFRDTSTFDNCNLMASVNLPHGATLTGFGCLLYDYDVSGASYAILYSQSTTGGGVSNLFQTPYTFDSNAGAQIAKDYSINQIGYSQVDNYAYAYYIVWLPANTTTVTTNARLYNCTITYKYES